MAVTLKEIASRAGVSSMAVSAVLNNRTNARVSPATRELILSVAQELEYRPNLLARSLSGGRSKMIGVIIDSYSPISLFHIIKHIEARSAALDYRIMIHEEHDSPKSIIDAYQIFEQYGVDGIICVSHEYPMQGKSFQKFFKDKPNVVLIGKRLDISMPCVHIDYFNAYSEAVKLFIKQGRTPLMIISNLKLMEMQGRINCYKEVCAALGIEAKFYHPVYSIDPDVIIHEMNECIDQNIVNGQFNALLVHSDLYSLYLYGLLQKHGISIGKDVAVVGFDNSDYCAGLFPSLSSIDRQNEKCGHATVDLILDLINGRPGPCEIAIEAQLIVRDSLGTL